MTVWTNNSLACDSWIVAESTKGTKSFGGPIEISPFQLIIMEIVLENISKTYVMFNIQETH